MSTPNSEFFGRIYEFSEIARETIATRYRNSFDINIKSDSSPVTEIDLAVERGLREAITHYYPSHGIIGEEFPNINPQAEYQWIIDPIDGTQNLVQRIPTFGTIIGLFKQGTPIVGLIDCPMMDFRVMAGDGLGTYLNGERISLNLKDDRPLGPQDVIACSSPGTFARARNRRHVFQELCAYHTSVRIYYDCYAHALAAVGSIAATVEYNIRIWDIAASQILIEQAGGAFEIIDQYEDQEDTRYSVIMGKRAVVAELAPKLRQWNKEAEQNA